MRTLQTAAYFSQGFHGHNEGLLQLNDAVVTNNPRKAGKLKKDGVYYKISHDEYISKWLNNTVATIIVD